MCLGAVGDIFSNEVSHIGNLFDQIGKNPAKSLEQLALGAADPFGAKLWGGITGQEFTPLVSQLGGETADQFAQSRSQGVNTGPSETLGKVADVIAGIVGGGEAASALGGVAGLGGGASGGAGFEGSAAGYAESGGGYVGPGEFVTASGAGSAVGGVAGSYEGSPAGYSESGGGYVGPGEYSGEAPATSGSGLMSKVGAKISSTSVSGAAKTAFTTLGPVVLSSLLAPKPPQAKAPVLMPDPLAEQEAQRQKILEQLARRGRSSTVLTGGGGNGLGG